MNGAHDFGLYEAANGSGQWAHSTTQLRGPIYARPDYLIAAAIALAKGGRRIMLGTCTIK